MNELFMNLLFVCLKQNQEGQPEILRDFRGFICGKLRESIGKDPQGC